MVPSISIAGVLQPRPGSKAKGGGGCHSAVWAGCLQVSYNRLGDCDPFLTMEAPEYVLRVLPGYPALCQKEETACSRPPAHVHLEGSWVSVLAWSRHGPE